MLERKESERMARYEVEGARHVLVHGCRTQGVNRSVESEFGLTNEDWENALPELSHIIRKHVGVPKRVPGAIKAARRERVEQPGGCSGENANPGQLPYCAF
jgi:hypothetical protein